MQRFRTPLKIFPEKGDKIHFPRSIDRTFKLSSMDLSKSICMTAALLLAACSQENIVGEPDDPEMSDQTCRVSFVPSFMEISQGDIASWQPSRAESLSDLATTLSYWDYLDGDCLQSDTLTLPSPISMTLKYGSHHLYFLAHSSTSLQQLEDRTFYPSKVTETFWTDFPLEADENLQDQQTVPMERVVTMVKVTLRDAMPQGVDSIRLTVDSHYRKLDLQTGNAAGSSGSSYSLSWKTGSEYAGRTGLSFSMYSFTPTPDEEFQSLVRIEALSADGDVLYSAEAPSVPLLRNRCTNASCRLFSGNTGISFADPDDWMPAKEIEM